MSKQNKPIPIYLNGVNGGIPYTKTQANNILNSPNVVIRSVYDGSYFTPATVPTSTTLIPGNFKLGQTYHVANYSPQTKTVWYHDKK